MGARLTPAQRDALDVINRDGVLYAFNGISAGTAQALADRGLCRIEYAIEHTRPKISSVYPRPYRSWVAYSNGTAS